MRAWASLCIPTQERGNEGKRGIQLQACQQLQVGGIEWGVVAMVLPLSFFGSVLGKDDRQWAAVV